MSPCTPVVGVIGVLICNQCQRTGQFEETDSAKEKVTYLYRLLVHDKLIQPLAKGQDSEPNMKHKLALWMSRQLPSDHPLVL